MRFNVLGDLEIVRASPLRLSARKQGVVLATLLSRPNQIVSMDQILTEVWGQNPPPRATASVYVYISEIRKFLAAPDPDRNSILTRDPGYSIRLDERELDYDEFCSLTRRGREIQQLDQHEEATTYFQDALALWRGPAFRNLRDGQIVGGMANWLDELRVECAEMLVVSTFRLGRHRESIGLLSELITEHPLNETFYQQLMHAFYRCNRRADALRVYQVARSVLKDELGLDPCRELQELQQAIIGTRAAHLVA